ncbi:MAG: 4a-hydroxytetrahydrobiopterin dehydratase [Nitrospirae bacterium]|nr:4a-hydroxytetrahydrobiopterin dehydratase [Candidatus Troglogloeales bacterium]
MDSLLSKKECIPCRGGVPPLKGEEIIRLLGQISPEWRVIDEHHLEREFLFPGFKKGLDFTVAVGEMAEEQGHHPDIHLAWGKVILTVWTHKINGLTESDFIFAAKADLLG